MDCMEVGPTSIVTFNVLSIALDSHSAISYWTGWEDILGELVDGCGCGCGLCCAEILAGAGTGWGFFSVVFGSSRSSGWGAGEPAGVPSLSSLL